MSNLKHNKVFEQGDRVKTPGGLGTVVYKRMSSTDINVVAAYSIRLDTANHNPLYTGSLFPAHQVSSI